MTGSSGGGSGGSFSGKSCDLLGFEAQVTSPDPLVVAKSSVGDVLSVTIGSRNGQSVVQLSNKGALLGGLTGTDAAALRDCIQQGHSYQATILRISGGQVRVRVEHI